MSRLAAHTLVYTQSSGAGRECSLLGAAVPQFPGVEPIMSMERCSLTLLSPWAQGGWKGLCARELKEGKGQNERKKEVLEAE